MKPWKKRRPRNRPVRTVDAPHRPLQINIPNAFDVYRVPLDLQPPLPNVYVNFNFDTQPVGDAMRRLAAQMRAYENATLRLYMEAIPPAPVWPGVDAPEVVTGPFPGVERAQEFVEAQQRAQRLLESHLSPVQLEDWRRHRLFRVTTFYRGLRQLWTIHDRARVGSFNVRLDEASEAVLLTRDGRPVHPGRSVCVAPRHPREGYPPDGDIMLGQKLLLECGGLLDAPGIGVC